MTASVFGTSLTDAWIADIEHLKNSGGEEWNLVTTISDPSPTLVDDRVKANLDKLLLQKGKQQIDTVVNTIFPQAMLRGCQNREQFYDRYRAATSRLRRLRRNSHGTYFGRLIDFPASRNTTQSDTTNQLEEIIAKLEVQLLTGGRKRFIYQAPIYSPSNDVKMTMGFPCLSFLSFQLDQSRLCLTAMYRNQYYFARALGNFIGLARLLSFVAESTGIELGSLTVHACHAEIDDLSGREVAQLLEALLVTPVDEVAA